VTDDGGTTFGQVQKVTAAPTREESLTSTNELKAFDSPIYDDVTIEVLGQGVVSGSSVRVGSVPILVGKRVMLIGTGFEISTTIQSVVWVRRRSSSGRGPQGSPASTGTRHERL